MFENHPKYRIWIFEFWHFQPIFVLSKLICLVTLFDRKLQIFKNSSKFRMNFFVHSKCKRGSLRSQNWMRHFDQFSKHCMSDSVWGAKKAASPEGASLTATSEAINRLDRIWSNILELEAEATEAWEESSVTTAFRSFLKLLRWTRLSFLLGFSQLVIKRRETFTRQGRI